MKRANWVKGNACCFRCASLVFMYGGPTIYERLYHHEARAITIVHKVYRREVDTQVRNYKAARVRRAQIRIYRLISPCL